MTRSRGTILLGRRALAAILWPAAVLLPSVVAGCAPDDDAVAASPDHYDGIPTLVAGAKVVGIGEKVAGKEPYLLGGVTDAMRLSDGTVVIADCQSSELRFFDEGGRHVRTVGGRGQGPGEFTLLSPRRIFPVRGDSIGAFDAMASRVTIFDSDGRVGRVVRVAVRPGRGEVKGMTDDGSLIVLRRDPYDVGMEPDTAGSFPQRYSLLTFDEEGNPTDSVLELRGGRVIRTEASSLPMLDRGPRLGHKAVIAVLPDRIAYGNQSGEGIAEFPVDLTAPRTLPTITEPEPVTDAIRREWEDMRADLRLYFSGACGKGLCAEAYSETMPAYGDLVAGRDGSLWVQDPYRLRRYPLIWTAYRDGEAVARAELPPRFFPFEFGSDYVLGVTYSDLMVERVQVLPLVPGEPSYQALTPREAQPFNDSRCGAWASR